MSELEAIDDEAAYSRRRQSNVLGVLYSNLTAAQANHGKLKSNPIQTIGELFIKAAFQLEQEIQKNAKILEYYGWPHNKHHQTLQPEADKKKCEAQLNQLKKGTQVIKKAMSTLSGEVS